MFQKLQRIEMIMNKNTKYLHEFEHRLYAIDQDNTSFQELFKKHKNTVWHKQSLYLFAINFFAGLTVLLSVLLGILWVSALASLVGLVLVLTIHKTYNSKITKTVQNIAAELAASPDVYSFINTPQDSGLYNVYMNLINDLPVTFGGKNSIDYLIEADKQNILLEAVNTVIRVKEKEIDEAYEKKKAEEKAQTTSKRERALEIANTMTKA